MNYSLLKTICVMAFKPRISVPKECFNLTEDSMLFTYHIDGRTRFITIEERENAAEFFKEQKIIYDYTGTGKNVRMFEEKVITVTGANGVPVMLTRTMELPWEKIKFFPSDVVHFAALNEYEIGGYKAGLSKFKNGLSKFKNDTAKGKLVQMSNQHNKAA